MCEEPKGVDLVAFADALPKAHGRLRGLIHRALDAHSAYSDLKVAADLAARALQFEDQANRLAPEFVEECTLALISTAVVTYVRATSAKSSHRRTFDIRAAFDEREQKEHKLLCNLRHDSIAHYGPGRLSPTAALREDFMILPVGEQQVLHASRHLAGSRSLAQLIQRQAQRATLVMLRRARETESAMVEALNCAIEADPSLAAVARKYEVLLQDVLGDAGLARDVLTGPRLGTRRYSRRGD